MLQDSEDVFWIPIVLIRRLLFNNQKTIQYVALCSYHRSTYGESKIKGGGPHHFPSLDSQASHAALPVVPAVLLPIVIGVIPLCPKGPDRRTTLKSPERGGREDPNQFHH